MTHETRKENESEKESRKKNKEKQRRKRTKQNQTIINITDIKLYIGVCILCCVCITMCQVSCYFCESYFIRHIYVLYL